MTDTVGTLTHDVVGTIAPVEAAVQPVLTTVTDTVGTLTNDVAGTIAPVEAAVQPVLDDGDRRRRHAEPLTWPARVAPVVEAAAQPVLAHGDRHRLAR